MSCVLTAVNIIILLIIVFISFKTNGLERFSGTGKVVTLFWRPGCGHCTRLKSGAWPLFQNVCRTAGVKVQEVQIDLAPDADARSAYALVGGQTSIPGVPFIIQTVAGGRPSAYQGDRSLASLTTWLQSM